LSTVVAALPQLVRGMLTTFGIALGGMTLAVLLGFLLGVARSYAGRALDAPLLALIELVRGIPLLVLMYLVFFGLPQLGVRISNNPAAIVALGLYAAALASEIVRGALASIPCGQSEAAAALGLGRLATLWRVILPQALRRMVPPFVALFALIVESSSLSALIDVDDLLQSARTFAEAHIGSAFPLYLTVLVMYFAINYPISAASRTLEKRLA
jgi:His/Glu/Gln/Arg/opine family amino acid ABC transporter permease subunit